MPVSHTDLRERKAALRRHYTDLRASLSPEERAAAEDAIFQTLFASPLWQRASLICTYLPIRGELNTHPILSQASSEGKAVALPVTVTGAAEGRMVFRPLMGLELCELKTGRFGIPEPPDTHPDLTLQDFAGALILVPGLAFDDKGFRIGYGGGYYDRLLAELKSASVPVTTVGLAYAVCRPHSLPREAHDIPPDYIIDERRLIATHGHA